MMSSGHIQQNHQVPPINSSGAPKQRLKSATMNKRMQRGFSKENDDAQYDEGSNHQNYHGYTGHLSNTGMPAVGGASYGANSNLP